MTEYRQTAVKSIGQTAQGIAEVLQVPALDINEPLAFWRSVSIALTKSYDATDAAGIAEDVIANFYDRDWDPEEYLDDDTGLPSVSAYEEILEIVQLHQSMGPDQDSTVDEIIQLGEEEEAGSDALATLVNDVAYLPSNTPIRELMTQILNGELIISPEWQRSYVWKAKRKKRFIESILIGLPIPSILTWKDPDSGKEFVIDGRQRLETLLRFTSDKDQLERLGINDKPFKTFTSKETLFAKGAPLEAVANKYFRNLKDIPYGKNSDWQVTFNTKTFHIISFQKLSRRQLYQVFERYNTGGVTLQAQEIRNAIYQDSNLHKHLWDLAREYADPKPALDPDVDHIAEDMRAMMDNKADRYGLYSFIGRVMAFTYFHKGRKPPNKGFQSNYSATVAAATVDFMDDYESLSWQELRTKWIRIYKKTRQWYGELALVRPTPTKVSFHAFLATVQLATTDHLMQLIDAGETTEQLVSEAVQDEWQNFALNDPEANADSSTMGIAIAKQNSTHFWRSQRDWLNHLRGRLGIHDDESEQHRCNR